MNSLAVVYLKGSGGRGLSLPRIFSSLTIGGYSGQTSYPYRLLAYIIAQVVKINEDVNQRIATVL